MAFCNTTGKDLKQPPVSYFALDDLFDYLTRRNSGSRGLHLSAVRSTVRCRGDIENDWERSMAKLMEEQKAARALTRKRNEAVRAEEEHARQQAKERDSEERGLRLTYEELVAREPCRGCGEAILDGLEPFPGTMYLSPEQRRSSTTLGKRRARSGMASAVRIGGAWAAADTCTAGSAVHLRR